MTEPNSILLLEDSPDDIEIIKRTLERGGILASYECVHARKDYQSALMSRRWDLILADYTLSGFDGLEALSLLKNTGLDIPFVVVSGVIGEEIAITAMKAGASDYVMKRNLDRLVPVVEREIREAKQREARRRTEAALEKYQQGRAFLAAIVESSDDAIISKDLNSIVTSWNKGAETLLGYTAAEAIGRPITFLMPPELVHEEETIIGRLRQGIRIDHYETKRRRKDGTLIDVSLTVSPIRDGSGRVIGASKILRDITEKKQLETAMRRANEKLTRLNSLRSEFTSMVSHELRTPLAAIKEGIDLVLDRVDGPVTADQEHTLSLVKSNVDRLARLVQNVLDFTRLESGRWTMDYRQTDLNVLIRQTSSLMEMAMRKKGLLSRIDVPERPVLAVCDSDKIQQVLVNLLDNAIKFTDTGGCINVTLEADKDNARILISDTGIGIPTKDQKKIFEMYGQSTFSCGMWRTGGVGVGLAVCQILVRQHGGTITVDSAPGQGATFRVAFPLSPANLSQGFTAPGADSRSTHTR